MTCNENSNDLWLQTAAKLLKVQISYSDTWAADAFYYKTCDDRFVFFYRKIPKENSLLNEEVSWLDRKRIHGSDKNENYDTEKLLSLI